MATIHDNAYALEKSIRESEEFKTLKETYEAVMNDDSSREMFESFRDTQLNLQEKQMRGEEISSEEVESAKKVVELVQQHEGISKLMESEQRLNVIINDISSIITKPLEELYSPSNE